MKTTNFKDRKTSLWLVVLYCVELVFCVTLAGCGNKVLRDFDRLEKKALKYGTVSVGAARVVRYDNCERKKSRERLIGALLHMRCKWLKDPKDRPQAYWIEYLDKYMKIAIDLYKPKVDQKPGKNGGKKSKADPNEASKLFAGLSEALETIMKNQPPRPSEIELIGFYMAAQKFVESELEELNLGKPVDSSLERFVVSLNLTAWVRGKAGATLVYIDLYPYEADSWCHEAAEVLEKLSKGLTKEKKCKEGTKCRKEWLSGLKRLGGFDFEDINNLEPPTLSEKGLGYHVASCHRWLKKNTLLPRIVQVERMGLGEYLILGERNYSETDFQVGGTHPIGLSGSLEMKTKRKDEGLTAKVRPLSLSFVAGERRAGWLFMPGKTTEGRMPPTERRIRMVVDIPKDLKKLSIHVHKVFLGPDLGILDGAAFKEQMANLDLTRSKLDDADTYPIYENYKDVEPRHYRLIKTRIRNLLHQGWAEEIVVSIPKSRRDCYRDAKK